MEIIRGSSGNAKLVKPLEAKHLMSKSMKVLPVGRKCHWMRDPNNPGSFILTFGLRSSPHVARISAADFPNYLKDC